MAISTARLVATSVAASDGARAIVRCCSRLAQSEARFVATSVGAVEEPTALGAVDDPIALGALGAQAPQALPSTNSSIDFSNDDLMADLCFDDTFCIS